MQSKELTSFYRAYDDWINSKGKYEFCPRVGLCSNLEDFLLNFCVVEMKRDEIMEEMTAQFEKAGLNHHYPFNNGDRVEYSTENKIENRKRIQWVKDHLDI